MRKALNALYDGAAAVAALFMVGLLVMVLLSITGRQFISMCQAPMPMPAT
jgi:TRAP-type C4-dicarboxylate transport system permease small subunit